MKDETKMLESIVVFAGAGASYATSPQFPLTKGFFECLDEEVTNDPLYRSLIQFLQKKHGTQTLDVEILLWAVEDIVDTTTRLQSTDSPGGYTVHHSGLLSGNQGHVINGLQQLFTAATRLKDQVNATVYRLYAHIPTDEELAKTWTPLLEGLCPNRRVDIFTTNYDRVLECAVRKVQPPIATGRNDYIRTLLDLTPWRDSESASHGTLTKLHGSVDWRSAGDDRIDYGNEHFAGHADRIILYPGLKGEPDREPFKLFHRHLASRLEACSTIIFIGYAFRDPYINELIREHIQANAQVVILDPGPPAGLPRLRRRGVTHIAKAFTVETARMVVSRVTAK